MACETSTLQAIPQVIHNDDETDCKNSNNKFIYATTTISTTIITTAWKIAFGTIFFCVG